MVREPISILDATNPFPFKLFHSSALEGSVTNQVTPSSLSISPDVRQEQRSELASDGVEQQPGGSGLAALELLQKTKSSLDDNFKLPNIAQQPLARLKMIIL